VVFPAPPPVLVGDYWDIVGTCRRLAAKQVVASAAHLVAVELLAAEMVAAAEPVASVEQGAVVDSDIDKVGVGVRSADSENRQAQVCPGLPVVVVADLGPVNCMDYKIYQA